MSESILYKLKGVCYCVSVVHKTLKSPHGSINQSVSCLLVFFSVYVLFFVLVFVCFFFVCYFVIHKTLKSPPGSINQSVSCVFVFFSVYVLLLLLLLLFLFISLLSMYFYRLCTLYYCCHIQPGRAVLVYNIPYKDIVLHCTL